MMTKELMPELDQNDAQLVSECLAGGRDAFGRIVERYQSLICSLAYSATGSLSQSEDLAQETFVTAWTQLAELREPAKLRSWLCGIARNLIGKTLRREGHEPVYAAQPLEAVENSPAVGPLPLDHVISEEEKAILWRSLERIPEIYREPLVLFYRQHQSVENVAAALDLTEETVRQRLSRGRKLLQEQVVAFVEGALENTNPTAAFTVGVLAALPLVTSTTVVASVASAGTAAAKGGATAKTAAGVAATGAVSAGLFFFFSLLGVLIFLGGCVGLMMGRAVQRSVRQLEGVIRFWRTIAIGFGTFVVLPLLVGFALRLKPDAHPGLYSALTFWMGLIYLTVLVALVVWLLGWGQPKNEESIQPSQKRFYFWLSLGMLVPTFFFAASVYGIGFHDTLTSQRLSGAEFQTMITQHKDATYSVEQYRNGSRSLYIKLSPQTKRVLYWVDASPEVLALLAANHIAYKTEVQGVDFEQFGAPWRLQGVLSFFITPMGLLTFLKRTRNGVPAKEPSALPDKLDKKVSNAFRAFATAVALALLAGVVFFGLATRWHTKNISAGELPKIISEYKYARFQVWHYSDGSHVLQVYPHNVVTGPFVAPANEQTLSLLAQSGIPFRTIVQGKDFGYRIPPGPMLSSVIMIILTAVAVFLLWLAIKGTPLCTFAFGGTFLAVFLLLLGMSLRDMPAYPKAYVSTARVKVSQWSNPAFPQDEKTVITSKPVLESVIAELDLTKKWGWTDGKSERALSFLANQPWVEIITNNQGGVFELSVNNDTPNSAAEFANAIAKSYCDYRGASVAEVLHPAVPDPKPYPYSEAKIIFKALGSMGVALVVGLVVAEFVAMRKKH